MPPLPVDPPPLKISPALRSFPFFPPILVRVAKRPQLGLGLSAECFAAADSKMAAPSESSRQSLDKASLRRSSAMGRAGQGRSWDEGRGSSFQVRGHQAVPRSWTPIRVSVTDGGPRSLSPSCDQVGRVAAPTRGDARIARRRRPPKRQSGPHFTTCCCVPFATCSRWV